VKPHSLKKNPSTVGSLLKKYRGWEYWNTYVFELPAYLRLAARLIQKGVTPVQLLKVNWALDHGGFAFASKYSIQSLFSEKHFPPTILFDSGTPRAEIVAQVATLQAKLSLPFPLILKPDNGRVGRGVVRVRNQEELLRVLDVVEGKYLVQEFCDLPFEAGVFFYRLRGESKIFSITIKEFAYVQGDGKSSIGELIQADVRLRRFDRSLSKQLDFNEVPPRGSKIPVSYVGNHAQGAVFRTGSASSLEAVLSRTAEILCDHPGFNYGRLDVRAATEQRFWAGDFVALEVNGVDSLATNIFDPSWSILDAYRQLFRQYDLLVDIAAEQRKQPMLRSSLWSILQRTIESESQLLRNHEQILSLGLR